MNLICPNCKIKLKLFTLNCYFCEENQNICKLNVSCHLKQNTINLRNYDDNVILTLYNYKMPTTNLEIILLENKISIDYNSSENIQEILFDLFKILLKHEKNLVFL